MKRWKKKHKAKTTTTAAMEQRQPIWLRRKKNLKYRKKTEILFMNNIMKQKVNCICLIHGCVCVWVSAVAQRAVCSFFLMKNNLKIARSDSEVFRFCYFFFPLISYNSLFTCYVLLFSIREVKKKTNAERRDGKISTKRDRNWNAGYSNWLHISYILYAWIYFSIFWTCYFSGAFCFLLAVSKVKMIVCVVFNHFDWIARYSIEVWRKWW